MVRIVEDLLQFRKIQYCPIHFVPALFAAMGMFAVDICSGDVVREQLGNVKIRLAMIALRELRNTWPVSGWIFSLFTKIVRQIRRQGHLKLQDQPLSRYASSQSQPGLMESGILYGPDATEDSARPRALGLPSQLPDPQVNSDNDPFWWESSSVLMSFDFPADWNHTVDENLWSVGLDFWTMPP